MNTSSISDVGSTQDARSFTGPDYECRQCGKLIFCRHGANLPNGRDFYETDSGRPHRCKPRPSRGAPRRRRCFRRRGL